MAAGTSRSAHAARAGGYMPGLDGLRAISVVAVLLYHAGMPWLPGGFLGVEVFFVISGYLITLLLTAEHGRTSTISLRTFWLRRARRLLPALYAVLAATSAVMLLFYRGELATLRSQLWSALAYVTNWYFIVAEQSYFAAVERPSPLQHLWSLAIEEQFYLLWPLLLLGLLRLFRGRLRPIALVVLAASVASSVWMAVLFQPALDPSRVYYGTDTRAAGLLLGAALALVWRPSAAWQDHDEVSTTTLDLAGMAAVGVLVYCFATIEEFHTFLYQGGFAVIGVASVVAIAAAVHPHTVIGRLVLSRRALTVVGVRSYSLYLWHWPIFVLTRPEIDVRWGIYPTLVLRLALTVIAAELSYRYVEVPIRSGAIGRWRERLAARDGARRRAGPVALAGAAAAVLLAVNVVGASPSAGGPAPSDTPAAPTTTSAASPAAADGPPTAGFANQNVALARVPGVAADSLPAAAAPTTTLVPPGSRITVIGDSVLLGAQDAMEEELGAAGYTVDFRAEAALMIDESTDALEATGAPVGETVIIGLGHNSLWERDRADFDRWAGKFDRESDELLATLESLGAERFIWVTLREPSEANVPPSGRKQYGLYLWYFPYVNERLEAVATRHPNVTLADWAAVSDRPGVTYDAMHLTPEGVRLMIDTIRAAGGF